MFPSLVPPCQSAQLFKGVRSARHNFAESFTGTQHTQHDAHRSVASGGHILAIYQEITSDAGNSVTIEQLQSVNMIQSSASKWPYIHVLPHPYASASLAELGVTSKIWSLGTPLSQLVLSDRFHGACHRVVEHGVYCRT